MLQQTRAETVIPYYERWLRRFPTVETLAAADPDDVLKHWEGLGYYSRARNLQRAALLVRERHAGTVPAEPSALRALPGIGEYTAGAIASIAYGRREPAVDGNGRRVLARLLDIAHPTPARLRGIAAAVVPEDRPGDFNQAFMDLGASICSPRAPRCGRCPIATLCRARARGTVHLRPRARRRPSPPTFHLAVAVLVAPGGQRLVMKRLEREPLGGLWCFPAAPIDPPGSGVAAEAAARTAVVALARELVRQRVEPVPIGVSTHAFTHRCEVYHAFLAEVHHAAPVDGGCWVDGAAIYALAMPAAQRRIAAVSSDGSHTLAQTD
jgi:A/G-specific adenine glycosylase